MMKVVKSRDDTYRQASKDSSCCCNRHDPALCVGVFRRTLMVNMKCFSKDRQDDNRSDVAFIEPFGDTTKTDHHGTKYEIPVENLFWTFPDGLFRVGDEIWFLHFEDNVVD